MGALIVSCLKQSRPNHDAIQISIQNQGRAVVRNRPVVSSSQPMYRNREIGRRVPCTPVVPSCSENALAHEDQVVRQNRRIQRHLERLDLAV